MLIAADVSAKSALWHSDRTDDRSKEIKLLIAEADLEVINSPGIIPTFRGRPGAQSDIDVTLVTAELPGRVEEWTVEDGLTSSDHNLVHVIVKGRAIDLGSTDGSGRNYKFRRADLELLKQRYAEQPPIPTGRADDMVKELTRKLRRAMNDAMPRVNRTKKVTKEIGTERLGNLKSRARRLRKTYQRTVTEGERRERLQAYRNVKLVYERELFETKIK